MWTSTDCSPIDFCLQNYNFSTDPQGDERFFSFYRGTSRHVIPTEGRGSVSMPAACFLCSFPLDGKSKIRHKSKGPKDQGRLHRTSPRLSKHLTFKSGSDFCKVKRKRPSLKVKRLAIPCGRFPARRPGPRTQPSRVLAFPIMANEIPFGNGVDVVLIMRRPKRHLVSNGFKPPQNN